MSTPYTNPSKRHDFILYFDCTDGNPNGDPDAGNLPRIDPETMQGLVTDVCIKRKVRNWIAAARPEGERYKIYVEQGAVLNNQHARAYEALGEKPSKKKTNLEARTWMCQNFYDIRMFGAVMTTGVNCGQVRGPAQFTFGRSVDPILPLDITITRMAVTTEDKQDEGKTMGRKSIIPYGLYRLQGFLTPRFAQDTGVTQEDLALFWRALENMWDLDRSASKGMMSCRGLHVFTHDDALGCAPAHKLFDRIKAHKKKDVSSARSFSDYHISIDQEDMPQGVSLHSLSS